MTSACLESVRTLLRELLDIGHPEPDDDLIATGAIDSLALIELLFQLEQRFAITLELDDIDPELFRTPESIARLVESKVAR